MATRSLELAEMLGKSKIALPTVLPTDLKQTLEVTAKPLGETQFGTPYVAAHEMALVPNPGFPPGISTGIGQAWIASGHTNPGGMVVGVYNNTAYFLADPTAPGLDSSWALGGASISSLPYASTLEASDETINDRVMTPQSVSDSFINNLVEHTVDTANGAGSAGLSIKLNARGQVDISMMPDALTSSLQYRGVFAPTAGTEYPVSPASGDMYVVDSAYTWTGGNLSGENGNIGDSLIYDGTHWSLVGASNASLDPLLPRDGSRPMTSDLGMGGNDIANVAVITGIQNTSELHNFKLDGIDNTIIMRVFAGQPTGLAVGELGVNTADNKIYVGDGTNVHMLGDHLVGNDDPNGTGDYLTMAGANAVMSNLPAGITAANPVGTLVTTGANTGTSDQAAREDHDHDNLYPTLVNYIQGGIQGAPILFGMLPTGTSSLSVAVGDHTHNNVYEPAFIKLTAFNLDFDTSADGHEGTTDEVARSDHDHDDEYMPLVTEGTAYNKQFRALSVAGAGVSSKVAREDHDHDADYEPVITKQTAFNKDFTPTGVGSNGTSDTVARSDHDHDAKYRKVSSVSSGTGAPTGGVDGDIYFQI